MNIENYTYDTPRTEGKLPEKLHDLVLELEAAYDIQAQPGISRTDPRYLKAIAGLVGTRSARVGVFAIGEAVKWGICWECSAYPELRKLATS